MKNSPQFISRMSYKNLMQTRLCDLPLSLEVPWFQEARSTMEKELKRRKVDFQPHYWISDEWFCPDGVPGVAVPFFLLHPRLIRLEREMMGFVDGSTALRRLKIMRHELGHAVDNAFQLRKRGGKQRIHYFGHWTSRYPAAYEPELYSRAFVRHLGCGYAQSHPDEDFAETFAVWMGSKSQWKQRYKNSQALEKLQYLDTLMNGLKGTYPLLKNKRIPDAISRQDMTLGEYYRRKKKKYGIEKSQLRARQFFVRLGRNVAKGQSTFASKKVFLLEEYLQENSKSILYYGSQQLQSPIYKLEPLYKQFIKESRRQKWTLRTTGTLELSEGIKKNFLKEARSYLEQGGAKIFL